MAFGRFKRALGGFAKAVDTATSEPEPAVDRAAEYGIKERFNKSGPGMLVGALRKKKKAAPANMGESEDYPEGGVE